MRKGAKYSRIELVWGYTMGTTHTFQTPHVEPLPAVETEPGVLRRITPDEADRIFRGLARQLRSGTWSTASGVTKAPASAR
jgi:hypothetical protein